MMKFSKLFFTLSLITASTLPGLAVANPPDPEAHRMGRHVKHVPMQRMLAGLELTVSQREDIKQLVQQHRAEHPQQRMDKASRAQMHALLTAEQFDELAVRQLLQQQQQQRIDQRFLALKLQHQVLQVLTPEQRDQLKDKHEKWQQQRGSRKPS
jgi:periplasmic protein CpxP/Spy